MPLVNINLEALVCSPHGAVKNLPFALATFAYANALRLDRVPPKTKARQAMIEMSSFLVSSHRPCGPMSRSVFFVRGNARKANAADEAAVDQMPAQGLLPVERSVSSSIQT